MNHLPHYSNKHIKETDEGMHVHTVHAYIPGRDIVKPQLANRVLHKFQYSATNRSSIDSKVLLWITSFSIIKKTLQNTYFQWHVDKTQSLNRNMASMVPFNYAVKTCPTVLFIHLLFKCNIPTPMWRANTEPVL